MRTGNTGRRVRIPICGPLARHIATLPRKGPHIHAELAAKARSQKRTGGASKAFAKILEAAGVSGVSFHCFRHTATSLLKAAGVPQAVVMDIIGHDSSEVSDLYTHMPEDVKLAALGKLPDFTVPPRS